MGTSETRPAGAAPAGAATTRSRGPGAARERGRPWLPALLLALLTAVPAAGRDRVRHDPHELQVGRYTVVADRRADRLPAIARRMQAMDLFLERVLEVPPERLAEPVVVEYLHRTAGLHRQLPFAGDRIGHEHLLPTDRGLWVLIREDDGDEDLRPVAAQVAELTLIRGAGEPPEWLRSGLYELLARVDLAGDQLVLMPPPFPDLHAAGLFRAPLEEVARPGWSRYQEPQRWYTSTLVVAFLLDTDPAALAAAVADPRGFDLLRDLDSGRFDAWVQGAVVQRWTGPEVLAIGVGTPPARVVALDEERLLRHVADLARLHRRPGRLARYRKVDDAAGAWMELRTAGPGEACEALDPRGDARVMMTRAACLLPVDPAAAERAYAAAYAAEPGLRAAALHAAALILDTPGREEEAAPLVRAALDAAPADPDARLLDAVLTARAGAACPDWSDDAPGTVRPPWTAIRPVEGALQRLAPRFVREVLECDGS